MAAALAQRNIPPHNPAATRPEDAYRTEDLVPPLLADALEVRADLLVMLATGLVVGGASCLALSLVLVVSAGKGWTARGARRPSFFGLVAYLVWLGPIACLLRRSLPRAAILILPDGPLNC